MTPWLARLPRLQPDLLRGIYDFNHRPAFWVHPEHFASFGSSERLVLEKLPLAHHSKLNAWVKKQLKVEGLKEVWNFENPSSRLALLPYGELQQLAYHYGAAHSWCRISSMIGKRQIADFKAQFGEAAYTFAVRKARQWPLDQALLESLASEQKSLSDEIQLLGWGSIGRVLAALKAPTLTRLKLKLPKADLEAFERGQKLPFSTDPWPFYQRLIPEILSPSQQSCFA